MELVDVGAGSSVHEVIAGNVHHQAVAFHFPSPAVRSVPSPLSAWLTIGQTTFHTESDIDVAAAVLEMANGDQLVVDGWSSKSRTREPHRESPPGWNRTTTRSCMF